MLQEHFEGQTPGVTPTVANSSQFGDDALYAVSIGTGNAMTYASDQVGNGQRSLKVAPAAGGSAYIAFAASNSPQYACSWAFNVSSLPTVATALGQGYNTGTLGQIILKPDGTFYVSNPVGDGLLAQSSSGLIAVNTWYRVDQFTKYSPTAGQVKTRVSLINSATALWSYDTGGAFNTGSTYPSQHRLGKLNSSGTLGSFWLDDYRLDTAASDWMGPYVQPPTLTAALYQPVSVLDVSASSGSGPLTYAITGPTGGAVAIAPGIWRCLVIGTYTVTITDTVTGLTTTNSYVCDPFAGMIERVMMNSDGTIS